MDDRQLFTIGPAARMAKCSPSTIRAMEARGLLPLPRRVAGQDRRLYTLADVEAIRAARAALLRRTDEAEGVRP